MDTEWVDFTVTKLDGARRQLEIAIALWFNDGEPVSVHMLTACAHQVFHAIGKKRGIKSFFIFNDSQMSPEDFKAYKRFVLDIENFFKHADRDPDPNATLTWRPLTTAFYILDAIELFHELGGKLSPLVLAFRAAMKVMFPEAFAPDHIAQDPFFIEARKLTRAQFLEQFLKIAAERGDA